MQSKDDSRHIRPPFARHYRDDLLDFLREHRESLSIPSNRQRSAELGPDGRAKFRREIRDIYRDMKTRYIELERFFEQSRRTTEEFFIRHIQAGTPHDEFSQQLKELHLTQRQLLDAMLPPRK